MPSVCNSYLEKGGRKVPGPGPHPKAVCSAYCDAAEKATDSQWRSNDRADYYWLWIKDLWARKRWTADCYTVYGDN